MSEPFKKISQMPEGYSPKNKPEILSMAEKILETITIEGIELTIITKKFILAGFEAPIDLKESHWQGMDDVKLSLKTNLDKIGGKTQPMRYIGIWKADPDADYSKPENYSKRLYFYGIEVSNLDSIPAFCVIKNFPESKYAIFKERQHGSPKYEWLKNAGYEPDRNFQENYALDMEIFNDIEDDGVEWDVVIPVKSEKGGYIK